MKWHKLILFIFIVFASGCEKLMHNEEISIGKITNDDELADAVAGIYGLLAAYSINYKNECIKGDDLNIRLTSTGSPDNTTNCYRFPSNNEPINSWQQLYKTIVSANNILSQFEDITILDKPASGLIAETYFLRAYCYYRLTRLYGTLPIIKNIEIDYNVPNASYSEIYQFIEKDLKIALEYLPKNNIKARIPYVTPHRGVAKALLAEVYLTWAGYPANETIKYSMAAQIASEVIDSAGFFGFRLLDDYAHVWDSAHFQNDESVLALYYSNAVNYNSLLFEGCYYGEIFLNNSSVEFFMDHQFNPKVDLKFHQVEINFYNRYPKNYRRDITFFTRAYITEYYRYNIPIGYYQYYNTIDICDVMGYRKFFFNPRLINYDDLDGIFNTYYYVGNPRLYLYRYAHTLLTYAEAKARSGQLDASAYEAVNIIRRRANHVNLYSNSEFDLQPGLTPEAFADSVIWERAWEFCGEPEGRWFDLVRMEKVEELPNIRNSREGGPPQYPISKSDYFFTRPE